MHNAPSVSYPVGRSRFAGALAFAAWLLGAATALSWWLAVPVPSWRSVVVAAAVAIAGALALFAWRRSPAGDLAWNGEGWTWSGAGGATSGDVVPSLDLQQWLLVRFGAGGAVRWLWLERTRSPARWDDLRRAVYSRARSRALPGAKPPAATT
jgi:toxin CptA